MDKHRYDIVTESGDIVLTITSTFTNLDFDAYAKRHIVPMLASLSAVEGERVFYTAASTLIEEPSPCPSSGGHL